MRMDAGAGSGAVSRVIARMIGPSGTVFALEKSPERARLISKLAFREDIANLNVLEGDLLYLPFGRGRFDLVWCEFVFEYLRDKTEAAQSLAAVVRPGGRLVIADID